MTLYKIGVFTHTGVMTATINNAWEEEGCELVVQSDYPAIKDTVNKHYAGALLDIKLRASYLFDLSEMLTLKHIPYVFVVTDETPESHYALNGGQAAIRLILDELLYQDDSGHRH